MTMEMWDLWFPRAGATGLSFARAHVEGRDARDRVLVHAAPPVLDVAVRDDAGRTLALGEGLERGASGPITFLVRAGNRILMEDGWPTDGDLGRVVILPGGEAGILKGWWNAEDRRSWRWTLELFNQI